MFSSRTIKRAGLLGSFLVAVSLAMAGDFVTAAGVITAALSSSTALPVK